MKYIISGHDFLHNVLHVPKDHMKSISELKETGMISNNITAALVNSDGSIEWMPMPRFDSSPVFCSIIDEYKGGKFTVNLDGKVGKQEYIAPNIVRTTFVSREGEGSVTDFLVPVKSTLIREIKSDINLNVKISPTFNYGKENAIPEKRDALTIFKNPHGKDFLELSFDSLEVHENANHEFTVKGFGQIRLEYFMDEAQKENERTAAQSSSSSQLLDQSIKYWESVFPAEILTAQKVVHEKLPQSITELYFRSLSVILGLMYSPSGSVVAAPTTSLPESIGKQWNWDYRYAWVRDSSIMAESLINSGLIVAGRRIIEFFLGLINYSGKPFIPFYAVGGTRPDHEKQIPWLAGLMNSAPVRVGNHAEEQLQLDAEGEFINAIAEYYRATKDVQFIKANWHAIDHVALWINSNWELDDNGPWEEPFRQNFTYSKVMMWLALDRAALLGKEIEADISEIVAGRNIIKEWIYNNCIKGGVIVKHPFTNDVDASLLTLPLHGFIEVKNDIFMNTLKKIEHDLVRDGLVYRYTLQEKDRPNHPFVLCSAWLSRVYTKLGKHKDAIAVLQKLTDTCGRLKLLGENIDQEKSIFLGNFPQGFAHAGVIMALNDIKDLFA